MYKIDIVGPGEYADVVAEIDCTPAFTAVVGLGAAGFFVQIFNFEAAQIEDFSTGRNVEKNSVDLETFLDAIGRAKSLLSYQARTLKLAGNATHLVVGLSSIISPKIMGGTVTACSRATV